MIIPQRMQEPEPALADPSYVEPKTEKAVNRSDTQENQTVREAIADPAVETVATSASVSPVEPETEPSDLVEDVVNLDPKPAGGSYYDDEV
ncbi:hypothetical protein HPB47_015500 [Ixodes persulcatus]|uniref:Uncharacterized protein n=1 Tax=Ixodes persulcatus TaxID=34615 RepID=A0AC60QWV6_IXOPE|nr:hypothetical protein HPB47_015500 [Ixodes persulcatus]